MSYAIRNRRTKKWWYGTDYRHRPVCQRTSTDKCAIFETYEIARLNLISRAMPKDYEVVPVIVEEVKEGVKDD